MSLISVVVILFVSFLTIIYAYFKYAYGYWKSRGVPHDEPKFPFGNFKGFGKTFHQSEFIKSIYDRHKSSGSKFCGIYIFAKVGVILMDLDLIKTVLVKDFANFNERGLYYNEEDDPLSAHLFMVDGEKWKKLRTKLTPTFTSNKMKYMFSSVIEVGERLKNCLIDIVKQNDEVEVTDLMARFTTDVIGTCAFGIECNSLKDPNTEFRHYGSMILSKPTHHRLVSILLAEFRTFAQKLHIKYVRDDVSKFFMKVVRNTVEYREKNNVQRNDLMDILIKLKNQDTTDTDKILTLNEIAAQVFLFFLAGFETSSTTLSYCLYELALNPEIQSKARRMIQEAFERHKNFTYEMMLDMPYIDQILHETLRKYPPLSNLNRKTLNDYQVPGTNHVIQRGTSVFIPIYAIQHDTRYYPDPNKFDPDRFNDEKLRNAIQWLPFGLGPRNCIGVRFGMMQTRVALVIVLNNFKVSLCSKTDVPLAFEPRQFILTPKNGIYLKFKAIK